MNYLTTDQIQEIVQTAVNTSDLLENWRELLLGIPRTYTASLPNIDKNPKMGLYGHLSKMNEISALNDGTVPLQKWLQQAKFFYSDFPESKSVFERYETLIAEKASKDLDDDVVKSMMPSLNASSSSPEKIIFKDDMVSYDFVAAGIRVSNSVAKLVVPRYQNGRPVTKLYSNQQLMYNGTGWLIGGRHIITNHHVIKARDHDERHNQADFELQGKETIVQFDYNHERSEIENKRVKSLVASNETLDYAILELVDDTGREPLPLLNRTLTLTQGTYIPMNLVQHPGGRHKKLGIRNNLLAQVKGDDIAYFTDTEPGSSGSPVCTDDWHVVGIHKASKQQFGQVLFQGKESSAINIGTQITRIIADLQENHSSIWSTIKATLVD